MCAAVHAQSPSDTAKQLYDSGHYKEARALLQSEVLKSPRQPALYYWLGKCAFELYDDDLGVASAERAVELEPSNAEYHYFLGTTFGHKAEHASWFSGLSLARKAQHEFLEAIQLNQNEINAQRDLISYDIAAPGIAGGGDDKAKAQIVKLFAINPLQGHLAQLEFFEDRRKWNEAAAEATSVLATKPKDVRPYLEVVEYLQNREDAMGMRNALSEIPREFSSDPHAEYYRAVADVLAGDDLVTAKALIETYLQRKPPPRREDHVTLADAHTWLGRLYEKVGQSQSAIGEYRTAIELEPKEKLARERLRNLGFD
jgi:tetratricopeptide (TPR) repeat protein